MKKIIIGLKKRKKPIAEFEQFAKAEKVFTKNFFLYFELVRLRVTFGLILATPAKEIKKMKLRQILKEAEKIKAKMEKA